MIFFLPSIVAAAPAAPVARQAERLAWPFRRKQKPKFRHPIYHFPPRRSAYFTTPRLAD